MQRCSGSPMQLQMSYKNRNVEIFVCVCMCVYVYVQVPPEIAQIAATLQKLLLPGNKLRSLPAQLSALTNLQHIDFRSGVAVTNLTWVPIKTTSLTLSCSLSLAFCLRWLSC